MVYMYTMKAGIKLVISLPRFITSGAKDTGSIEGGKLKAPHLGLPDSVAKTSNLGNLLVSVIVCQAAAHSCLPCIYPASTLLSPLRPYTVSDKEVGGAWV